MIKTEKLSMLFTTEEVQTGVRAHRGGPLTRDAG